MKNYNTAYLLARVTIGMSMFSHGFIRLTKLSAFSAGMVASYEKSLLPISLVTPFSMVLPVLEFAIGVCLLFGLFTRAALIAGVLLMMVLIFGTGILEHWDAIPSQLIHAAWFIILLLFIEYNTWCADRLMKRSK